MAAIRPVRLARRFARDTSGVAAVEAALVLPLFVGLVLGAIDTSLYLVQTHRVEQGLSVAGNYLSKAPDPASLSTRAANIAATGSPTGTGEARVSGWAPSDITITIRSESGDFRSGSTARVVRLSTAHSYQGFGLLSSVSGGRVTIRASHEERIDM